MSYHKPNDTFPVTLYCHHVNSITRCLRIQDITQLKLIVYSCSIQQQTKNQSPATKRNSVLIYSIMLYIRASNKINCAELYDELQQISIQYSLIYDFMLVEWQFSTYRVDKNQERASKATTRVSDWQLIVPLHYLRGNSFPETCHKPHSGLSIFYAHAKSFDFLSQANGFEWGKEERYCYMLVHKWWAVGSDCEKLD